MSALNKKDHLISTTAELEELLEKVSSEPVYAIDTEFVGERKYKPKLALIQIGWAENSTALIDPLAIDPLEFARFLTETKLAIMHSASQDLQILMRYCGTVPTQVFDTQFAAGFVGFGHPSLASLLSNLLDVQLPKIAQLTDWLQRPLTPHQLEYAWSDVEYLIPAYRLLEAKLEKRGRLTWLKEESELMRQKSQEPCEIEDNWKSIKQIHKLGGSALTLAIDLSAWREAKAEELDIPIKGVLNDMGLVMLAQSAPRTRQEFKNIRILNSAFRGRSNVIDEILDLVALDRSAVVANGSNPNQPEDKPPKALLTIILAWINSYALELEIHSPLLATRNDLLEYFAKPATGRLLSGWRGELLNASLSEIADGRASVAISHEGKLIMEERSLRPLSLNGKNT